MHKVSNVIARFLQQKNITHVFGIIGAGNVHIFDSIHKLGFTQVTYVHHEQAALMAMTGYYRATGRICAAIVTTGGGSTNAFTGLVSGWMDSVPGLIIAGNENSKFTSSENPLRIWGIQGYDSVKMAEKYTKVATRVMASESTIDILENAYNKIFEKRFGMSWVEIPLNIQSSMIENDSKLDSLKPSFCKADVSPTILKSVKEKTEMVIDLLKESKKPLLWLGNGIRLAGAEDLIHELVHKFKIPTLVSWAGTDLLNYDDEFNFGSAGIYGQRAGNFILQNCDLLITIGTRLSIMQVGYEINEFARDAKIVFNDIDYTEIQKLEDKITLPILCDSDIFIKELLKSEFVAPAENFQDWLNYCNSMKEAYPKVGFENQDKNGYINSSRFIEKLSSYLLPRQVITTDMGTALISGHQNLLLKDGQKLFTSTGLGEMGFGLPAAIGASVALNKGNVICLNCDGGMMLNLQELQTIAHHKLPIKIFIFNNDGYLMIKHTQKALFKGVYSGTNPDSGVSCPNFSKIATAFNQKYYSIKTWEDFDQKIEEVVNLKESCICEIFMDPEQLLVPKLSLAIQDDGSLVSPPLEDLSPLLSRAEVEKNMLIGIHPKSINLKVN